MELLLVDTVPPPMLTGFTSGLPFQVKKGGLLCLVFVGTLRAKRIFPRTPLHHNLVECIKPNTQGDALDFWCRFCREPLEIWDSHEGCSCKLRSRVRAQQRMSGHCGSSWAGVYVLFVLLILSIHSGFLCMLLVTLYRAQKYQQWVGEGKKRSLSYRAFRGKGYTLLHGFSHGSSLHSGAAPLQEHSAEMLIVSVSLMIHPLHPSPALVTRIHLFREIITIFSAPRHAASLNNKKSRSWHLQTHNAQIHLFWSLCCWEPPSSHPH